MEANYQPLGWLVSATSGQLANERANERRRRNSGGLTVWPTRLDERLAAPLESQLIHRRKSASVCEWANRTERGERKRKGKRKGGEAKET